MRYSAMKMFPDRLFQRGKSSYHSPGREKVVESHTAPTKFGMGDFYGTSMKQPEGKVRDSSTVGTRPVSRKGLSTPPKGLA